ncbi:MAG TPA: ABC transporter ATP-binding protein [Frankiaceae bacterium]|nr:ABC transporter ATP-binding protein [Frankiaceae bacterium]
MSVLEVRDLSIRFGGLQALEDVALTVNEYEIVGLIGPNGAGKTTAFNCITGFYRPNTGAVRYRGADVTRVPPHQKAAMGFGRTFQNVGMVKSATALENLKTAQHAKTPYLAIEGLVGGGSSWQVERDLEAKADAILDLLGLQSIRDVRVGGLSYGTLKLLELGCALATDPDVLLLDEPTSGMGPEESDQLGQRLLDLRKEFGLTMLLIEHHVPLVLRVCDYVYVLNFGRLLAEGKPEVIQSHPEVVAAYLGGEAPEALEATEAPPDQAELEASEHAALEGAPVEGAPAGWGDPGQEYDTQVYAEPYAEPYANDEYTEEYAAPAEEPAPEDATAAFEAAAAPAKPRKRAPAKKKATAARKPASRKKSVPTDEEAS